jgi:acyl-CoA thioester hydrolase
MSRAPAGGPFTGFSTGVRPEWLDYNGHLTDWAYSVVCSQANEALIDALDLGASYRERTGCALYTVEARLRFLAEVRPDTRLRAVSVVIDADAKRLRLRTTLLDDAGTEVLTGEYLYLHVDGRTGRVAPFRTPVPVADPDPD